jgi:hypothetical protein
MANFNPARRDLFKDLLKAAGCAPLLLPAWARANAIDSRYVDLLRKGNVVVLIRHAETVPGIGDPPGMRLDRCETQRDLSQAGRIQSRQIGQWFARHQLTPAAVRSSQWCRCLNTAAEAFGPQGIGQTISVTPWTALNSFFQGHGNRNQQIEEAAQAARAIAMRRSFGQFEVWVTHQVVVSTLTGKYLSMGECIVAAANLEKGAGVSSPPMQVLAEGLLIKPPSIS